ncbi:phosphoenolpyruvate synthase [Mucilaginibacter conchicola]|uniref:Prodigiosin synthesizing transferase PigC n=1 Tax=Mucilaginibacter conchicola TaxID=2303333 RepID=A0A372NXU1_9SPHI|nr:phosphoenolpyruvate synthase [Mucilaginibacter conchicola]RFZ94925.1 phosphoenolpyruvate synthase [Mucilaginibacter conchicola]
MQHHLIQLNALGTHQLTTAGGKGANLGELCKIDAINVPDGFCITTEAFNKIISVNPSLSALLNRLSDLKADEYEKISNISQNVRRIIEDAIIPGDITAEIKQTLANYGEGNAWAVRSSATAEDLPGASFAGQQDTFLNIIGTDAILKHISKCWASLFTERAVTYRIHNRLGHDKISLAVVVQQMVLSQVSGVMFTADPINGNRKIISIDATFGLGEAFVSGLVMADNYKVNNGIIIDKTISTKKMAIVAKDDGGTIEQDATSDQQTRHALTDEQIVQLADIGRKVEKHFGTPQDIEWCLADDKFYIVQSRPVTTLFPIPENNDGVDHVYISVGHQQMMTDAIKPLGLSLHQMIASIPMYKAAGRLFVDILPRITSAAGRAAMLDAMEQHDPLIKDALVNLITRGDIVKPVQENAIEPRLAKTDSGLSAQEIAIHAENGPAIVNELIKQNEESIAELKQTIEGRTGVDLIDFILADTATLKSNLHNPKGSKAIMAGMNAARWLNESMQQWLGEKNVADTLSQSAPNNVTAEMGLELLDVADMIRPYPAIVAYLENADDYFLNGLTAVEGGAQTAEAIGAYLDKYGVRCPGEIDITRTRWSEKPSTFIPLILSSVKNSPHGAGKQKFEQGILQARNKEQDLLSRLKQLKDGEQKAADTKIVIDILRALVGYREYPKYGFIKRYWVYKQALLKEAQRLQQTGIIEDSEDIYYLTFTELRELVNTNQADKELISKRKEEFQLHEKLTPPRVITSDGEIITGHYKRENLPANALAGIAVSSGIIEGRARVLFDVQDAKLEEGDILVTKFTDPSWTPLFVSIKGLVTEVGGLMTHGAVIAREYGLPAVVGVENATGIIQNGQMIRLNGTDGYIELL